jgi:uncharacterized membrane protein YedE/YeeE
MRRIDALIYTLFGMLFGIILIKAQVISWFRIQEMFRFQSFHMFGIIGSAIAVAMLGLYLIKRKPMKALNGEQIVVPGKIFNKGMLFGGMVFGLGWALVGSCPGPMYALVGLGYWPFLVVLFSAIFGTWL